MLPLTRSRHHSVCVSHAGAFALVARVNHTFACQTSLQGDGPCQFRAKRKRLPD